MGDSTYRSLLQCQGPPLGAEIALEITGSGIFPANERRGVIETCFETPDPWGSLAAEVLLDLKQDQISTFAECF